jgi:hypothetical protein
MKAFVLSGQDVDEFLVDFEDGNGAVPAHHHPNADGSSGGWVARTAYVDPQALIGDEATVYGRARILGPARLSGRVRVRDRASILGPTELYGPLVVEGRSCLVNGEISGRPRVAAGDGFSE